MRRPSVWSVSTADKTGIGTYLVAESTNGSDALTVYVFKKDTPGSGASACDSTCATTWPPFVIEAGETLMGMTGVGGQLGNLTRAGGVIQVTYNGLPLYFYSGDHGAGDTNGQGIAGQWSAATP